MELHPPGATRGSVRRTLAAADLIKRQLPLSHDPSRLAQTRIPVHADLGAREDRRELRAEKPEDVVGLRTALEHHPGRAQRIERRLEVRHVRQHEVLAGKVHQETVVTHESVFRPALGEPLVHVLDHQILDRLDVVPLDEKVQRPVHGRIRLANLESGFVGQARIARGIDIPAGRDANSPEASGEVDVLDAAAFERDTGHHSAHDRLNTRRLHLPLHPSSQTDFVVLEGDRAGHRHAPMERPFRRQLLDQLIGDAVRQLIRMGSMGVEADDGADDRSDRLAAERRRRVDDHDAAAERRRFERRSHAGNTRTDDADVGLDRLRLAVSGMTYGAGLHASMRRWGI